MPDEDLTQISLGKFRVGITGLKAAIEEVKSWRGRPEEEIAQALLARVKPRNYIPASAQEEYKRAFWREFKKALGEKVEEERSGLSIKILGPAALLASGWSKPSWQCWRSWASRQRWSTSGI